MESHSLPISHTYSSGVPTEVVNRTKTPTHTRARRFDWHLPDTGAIQNKNM